MRDCREREQMPEAGSDGIEKLKNFGLLEVII